MKSRIRFVCQGLSALCVRLLMTLSLGLHGGGGGGRDCWPNYSSESRCSPQIDCDTVPAFL